jgi:hypothetical protein
VQLVCLPFSFFFVFHSKKLCLRIKNGINPMALRGVPARRLSSALQGTGSLGRGVRRALSSSSSIDETASESTIVGLGFESGEIVGVSRTVLMRELMSSIDQPGRTMEGVTSVILQPATGDAGAEGALWRRMVVHDDTYIEHIYANPARGEIRRIALEDDGSEGDLEVVNQLRKSPLRIEIFQRQRSTLERTPYRAPLVAAIAAVDMTIALARAKEAQEADACYFGSKA